MATRAHPEYAPAGINLGLMVLHPVFNYTGTLNDNVFADNDNKKSSYVSEYSPEIASFSNWNNHALEFLLKADIGRNHTFSSEDYDDWLFSTRGRLDIKHNIQLYASADLEQDHIERTSPNEAGGIEPTQLGRLTLSTRYVHELHPVKLELELNNEDRDYDNVPAIRNGLPTVINNDDRDRSITNFIVKGGHSFLQDNRIFIKFVRNRRDYDHLQDVTGLDRSSTGYEASAGLELDISGIIFGELSAGYTRQDYEPGFTDISKPVVNASIRWNRTELTTYKIDIDRSIRETIGLNFSGFISTAYALGVEHEYYRNLMLETSLVYISDDYISNGISNREDTTYDIIIGSTYLVNRRLILAFQYHYLQRESVNNLTDESVIEFDNNIFFIQLQTQI